MRIDRTKLNIELAKNKMTLKEFCDSSGVNIKTMYSSFKASVRPDTVGRVAESLNVQVEDIIRGDD